MAKKTNRVGFFPQLELYTLNEKEATLFLWLLTIFSFCEFAFDPLCFSFFLICC